MLILFSRKSRISCRFLHAQSIRALTWDPAHSETSEHPKISRTISSLR
jgi:hypothetical protein